MRKYWPLLVIISTIILVVPAFAQEVPACTVQAVGGTFSSDLIISGKVGIGVPQANSKLDVSGNVIVSGDINAGRTITGAQYCIGNSCIQAWPAGGGGGLGGQGTSGKLSKWSGQNSLADSRITESEDKISINGDAEASGTLRGNTIVASSQFCIGQSCIDQWPQGGEGQADGTGGWTEGADTTSTNKKVSISNSLEATGTVKAAGFVATGLASCAGKLYTDANGNLVCGEDQTGAAANAVTGQGAANTLIKWTGANQIGNSVISESNGNIGIGLANPSEKLEVAGKIKATIIKGNTICLIADDGTEDCKQAWPAGEGGGGEIDWSAITNIPAGFADSKDDVGIAEESDPKVGAMVNGKWCKSDGNQIICQDDLPALDEADPLFSAWDKSTGITITESQISDLHAYLIDEQDPAVDKLGSVGGKLCTYDGATKKIVCTSEAPADVCSVNVFAGITDAANDGNIGSYADANDICNTKIAGSHVCTSEEILKTINCGKDMGAAGDNWGWVTAGPPGFTASANDCEGWTTNAGNSYGRLWNFGNNKGSLTSCNSELRFACCK